MSLLNPLRKLIMLSLVWIVISTAAMAQKKTYVNYLGVPDQQGRTVLDEASLLKTETVSRLEDQVRHYNDSSGYNVAVVVIYDLEGDIKSFAKKIIREWKLGKPDEVGVLLLVVEKKREMRIEVGKGLIDKLTPEECNRIIYNEMVPAFKEKEYDQGMIAGVKSMLVGINGNYQEKTSSFDVTFWMTIASAIIIFVVAIGQFSKYYSSAFYGGLLPFFALTMGMYISWWGVAIYAVAFPILRWLVVKSGVKQMTFGKHAGGGNREEDEYDRINRRNSSYSSSSDSGSSSSSSSSDRSGSSGSW